MHTTAVLSFSSDDLTEWIVAISLTFSKTEFSLELDGETKDDETPKVAIVVGISIYL